MWYKDDKRILSSGFEKSFLENILLRNNFVNCGFLYLEVGKYWKIFFGKKV